MQVALPTSGTRWSRYQTDIFEEFGKGTGHVVIEAVAGSGKTTTILEGIRGVRRGARVLFCAFNRETANVLAARVPAGVQANTTHGVGFRAVKWAWRQQFPKIELDRHRERNMLDALEVEAREQARAANLPLPVWAAEDKGAVLRLVSFAKAWVMWSEDRLRRMAEFYDCQPARMTKDQMVDLAARVIRMSLAPSDTISYDDMVFLPVALKLSPKPYDLVVVDETQDLNRAQVELALMSLAPGGRIVAVGDSRQAIYAFRGADKDSMSRLVKRLNAKTMPLSVTYRCPRAVVAHVQKYVPHIQASEAAPEGVAERCEGKDMVEGWGVGDFVLSRVNAPLVRLCVRAWRRNIPAVVLGKDVGRAVREFVDDFEGDDITGLINHTTAWGERETKRLTAAKREDEIDRVRDRVEMIVALAEGMASVRDLRTRINRLFADPERVDENGKKTGVDLRQYLVFSSTHKAKGLEAERVWVLQNTYRPGESEEEDNLYYVACTRVVFKQRDGVVTAPGTLKLVCWDYMRDPL